MKLIVLAVVSIAVFTANCQDIPDGPQDQVSTAEPEQVSGEPVPVKTGFSTDVDGDFPIDNPLTIGRVQDERQLRGGSKCKSDIVCSLLGGSCVSNSTYCSGREVPSVCSGSKCKCCIPVTLEVKVHDLETELRAMVVNLTTAFSNLHSEMKKGLNSIMSNLTIGNSNTDLKIETLTSNFTNANSEMNNKLQVIEGNMTKANANQDSKLDSIKKDQGCPKGLFFFTPSNQCFRLLNDTRRNWYTANSACSALGLKLAHPYDPVSLRSYIATKYGSDNTGYGTWIGGRGTGSYMAWLDNGKAISSSLPLWHGNTSPSSYKSTSYCLALMNYESYMKSYPTQPLYPAWYCSYNMWTLCELVRE